MTVTVFGFLTILFCSVSSLVLAAIEKIYQTRKTLFDHNSKQLELSQKQSITRRIFNSLLGVRKCGQTWSFLFGYILRENLLKISFYTDL